MDKVWAKLNFDLCPRFLWFLLKVTLNISPRESQSRRLQKHKIGIFRDAVKYFIRNI